jgi:hypothetical protein
MLLEQSSNQVTPDTMKVFSIVQLNGDEDRESKKRQIDSAGLDLTLLSQLPPHIRSEARLAMALAKQQQAKKHRTTKKNLVLERWLLTQNSTENEVVGISGEKLRTSPKPLRSRKKQKKGIEQYFQK